jgi:hypothetical protein
VPSKLAAPDGLCKCGRECVKKSRRHCCGPNTHVAQGALTLVPCYISPVLTQSGIPSEYLREAALPRLSWSGTVPSLTQALLNGYSASRLASGSCIRTFIWPGPSPVHRLAVSTNQPPCWRGYSRARQSTGSPIGTQPGSPRLRYRTRQDCARCAFQCPHHRQATPGRSAHVRRTVQAKIPESRQ